MPKFNEMKDYTLDNLNMCYVQADCNEDTPTGAILKCSHSWTIPQLSGWLPDYDYDMLESVKDWLANDAEIAEGGYLEVWV